MEETQIHTARVTGCKYAWIRTKSEWLGNQVDGLLLLFANARDSICACPTMKRTCFSSLGIYARILVGIGSGMVGVFDEKNSALFH
jgi:hypothetical protein